MELLQAQRIGRRALICLRCCTSGSLSPRVHKRAFAQSSSVSADVGATNDTAQSSTTPPIPTLPNPETSWKRRDEKILRRHGITPVGSRRRRAALNSQNIPFEQLPYQCFQEARKVLAEDRLEKLEHIAIQKARIAKLQSELNTHDFPKQERIRNLEKHLEYLKIQADINDPLVKKRFEDGFGDMNRPVYRHLADKKWRSFARKLLMQRIEQMHIAPDVLPKLDPVAEVTLKYLGKNVTPGDFVLSKTTQDPPTLRVQPFDKGQKKVTIAVIDSDVPNQEKDGFDYRCHFLASNFAISPTDTHLTPNKLQAAEHTIIPWHAVWSHRGAPYHRLSILVFQQPEDQDIDVKVVKETADPDGFIMRSFADKHGLTAIGANLFRIQWDDTTADVMRAHGADPLIEFRRKRAPRLPYKKKDGARYR